MEYTLDIIIERLSQPEKLIDPQEISILQSYLNGHITDEEEVTWGKRLVASHKLADLNKELSAAKSKVEWEISIEYIEWQTQERLVRKLKRYRADLRDRFQVLTNTRHHGH